MEDGGGSFWGSLNNLTFGPQFRVESASADFTVNGQIVIEVSNPIGSMPLNGFHIEIDGVPLPNHHVRKYSSFDDTLFSRWVNNHSGDYVCRVNTAGGCNNYRRFTRRDGY